MTISTLSTASRATTIKPIKLGTGITKTITKSGSYTGSNDQITLDPKSYVQHAWAHRSDFSKYNAFAIDAITFNLVGDGSINNKIDILGDKKLYLFYSVNDQGHNNTYSTAKNTSLTLAGSSDTVILNPNSYLHLLANSQSNTVTVKAGGFFMSAGIPVTYDTMPSTVLDEGSNNRYELESGSFLVATATSATFTLQSSCFLRLDNQDGRNNHNTFNIVGDDVSISSPENAGSSNTFNISGNLTAKLAVSYGTINLGDGDDFTLTDSHSIADLINMGMYESVSLAGNGHTLQFGRSIGTANVSGFNKTDKIRLSIDTFSDWNSLINGATDFAGDVILTSKNPGEIITLVGVHKADLVKSQFVFV